MRGIFVFLFFVVLVSQGFAQKLVVAVSLQPYANLAQKIGGERVEVVAMLPPGADPHTFEPKPATLQAFSKAKIYLSDGSGMDVAWMPRFKGVNPDVVVASITTGITWIEHHEEHEHHGEELDPHVWTSPMQVRLMAENIFKIFSEHDGTGKEYYASRLATLVSEINQMDLDLKAAVGRLPKESRTFIVFHPSYGYLARDYGMMQLSIEMNGKEPKPKDLKRLVEEGRKHKVKVIFVQPQFSKRSSQTIAKELGAVIESTDPLAYDFSANIQALIGAIERAGK